MISEFPLFVFTTLAGLAAGAYIVNAFFAGAEKEEKRPWLFPLVCLVLLVVGLLAVTAHVGRPLRLMNAFANPSSMITEEAYWSIAFGLFLFIDLVFAAVKKRHSRVVEVIGGILAGGLVVVMSLAYFTAYAVDAWASWPTFLLYIVGDAAMGAALYALFYKSLLKGVLAKAVWALAIAFALSAVVEAVQFVLLGEGFAAFVVAAIVALVAAVLGIYAGKGGDPVKVQKTAPLVFVLVMASVVIARYMFYTASIL